MTTDILLRDVQAADLDALFEFGRDPESVRMAAFTHEDPSDRAAFDAHWARLLADPSVRKRVIVAGGKVVGSIASWGPPEEREVTYWIGRAHWGRGLATAALSAFLREETARPLFGRASKDNAGSVRVLAKCGFRGAGESRGFANARGEEIDEVVLRLDAPSAGPPGPEIRTERLLLRRWRESDLAPFAALNADPRVVEHLPRALTREESDAFAARIEASFAERGFSLFAVEAPGAAPFAGYVGLWTPKFEAAFTPCVEIGWRLAYEHWGRGYASEAARASLEFGFRRLGLEEIVSFTVPANRRSIAVMERIGMRRDLASDFDHPALPEGHRLRPHVLYRMTRRDWEARDVGAKLRSRG